MLFAFLVTLREGFEIALIIAIVLGYLDRTGNRSHFRAIWLGTGLAVVVTTAVVIALEATASELSGTAKEAFEGIVMLGAVVVLTWMVLWMRRQAASLGRELRARVDLALEGGSVLALAGLAFSAVIREGIETALFLSAGASAAGADSALRYWGGGALGFALAGALGYIVYRGAHVMPVRQFFTVTGAVVLLVAAGLLSNGLSELQHSGLVPTLGSRPWDTDALLSLSSTAGKFMHTLVGYDSAPTWGNILAYWGYLAVGLALFLGVRPRRRTAARASA